MEALLRSGLTVMMERACVVFVVDVVDSVFAVVVPAGRQSGAYVLWHSMLTLGLDGCNVEIMFDGLFDRRTGIKNSGQFHLKSHHRVNAELFPTRTDVRNVRAKLAVLRMTQDCFPSRETHSTLNLSRCVSPLQEAGAYDGKKGVCCTTACPLHS